MSQPPPQNGPYDGLSNDLNTPAIQGENTAKGGIGVLGRDDTQATVVSDPNSTTGVLGHSTSGRGVWGQSDSFIATVGDSTSGTGVLGRSNSGPGVVGRAAANLDDPNDQNHSAAVWGRTVSGKGIYGESVNAEGVYGESANNTGVFGISTGGQSRGVWGKSDSFLATVGDSVSGIGVYGRSQTGTGVFGQGSPAGHFEGNVEVTGNVQVGGDVILTGADCAEEFDVAEAVGIEPGTVMVLDQDGKLQQCCQAYDKKVAGVVSGAGDYRPGLILDRQQSQDDRMPIALMGKVYCKADAQYAPIAVGDLLTTSSTPGYAMKAGDQHKAFGSIIGKALKPLKEGQELIPILIVHQ